MATVFPLSSGMFSFPLSCLPPRRSLSPSLSLIIGPGSFYAMGFHVLLWFRKFFFMAIKISEISYLCLGRKKSQLTQIQLFIDLEEEEYGTAETVCQDACISFWLMVP